jgi:hypothetical protein
VSETQPSTTFPVKPEQFWAAWSEKLRSDWKDPQNRVRDCYNDAKLWTPYITDLVKNLSAQFSCTPDTEYFARLDVAYFDKPGADWSEWALEVAIELENGLFWQQELCKLLLVNAGLKVLIAYDDDHENIHLTLNSFISIHRSRKYVTSNCGWLFIFGPRLVGPDTFASPEHDFVAFTFNGNAIIDITGGKQTIC